MNTKLTMARILALLFAILCFALVLLSQGAKADITESNVAIYMDGDEDNLEYADAFKDDTVYFNLSLENYNSGDSKDRFVVLFVDREANVGDPDRWDFKFVNPIGGYNQANFTYKDVDYFRYLVEGDGTPCKVEIEIDHYFTSEGDNQDRMEFQIRAYDFEANTPPPEDDNWTRFYGNMVDEQWGNPDGSTPSNMTYLLDDRAYTPDVDTFAHEIHLNTRVVSNPFDPEIYVMDSIVVTPGEKYTIQANIVNEGQQEDEIKFTAELDHTTEPYWQIESTNYIFGTKIQLDSEESELIYIEITAPRDFEEAPEGEYDLILEAVSEGDKRIKDTKTVKVVVPQRYDPLLTVIGDADKNAATDGSFTSYNLRLRNDGALDESFDLFAEVQDRTARAAGATDAHWEKTFSLGVVTVNAGSFVEFTVSFRPELDNEKIPPGKYPVRLVATSQNNSARFSETAIVIRMPNLYNPEATLDSIPPSIQVGNTGDVLFTITNNGVVEDTMTLDFVLKGEEEEIFTAADPGDWSFVFKDGAGMTINAPYQLTLGTTSETKSRSVHLYLTPTFGVLPGDYEFTIITKSEGPVSDWSLNEWQGSPLEITVTLPDLYIFSSDISFDKAVVNEGDHVTITATVHLDGSIGTTPVKVGFFYHTAAQGFVSIGTEDLNFGGAADTTQDVEFTWVSVKVPQLDKGNIRVVVDTYSDVLEDNEDNNAATATLTVEPDNGGDGGEGLIGEDTGALLIPVAIALVVLFSLLGLFAGSAAMKKSEKTNGAQPPSHYAPYRPGQGNQPAQQYSPNQQPPPRTPPPRQQAPPQPQASFYNYQQSEPVQVSQHQDEGGKSESSSQNKTRTG